MRLWPDGDIKILLIRVSLTLFNIFPELPPLVLTKENKDKLIKIKLMQDFKKRETTDILKEEKLVFISLWFEVSEIRRFLGFWRWVLTRTSNWMAYQRKKEFKLEKKNNRGINHSAFQHKHNTFFGNRKYFEQYFYGIICILRKRANF